jgi:hypothetical protein
MNGTVSGVGTISMGLSASIVWEYQVAGLHSKVIAKKLRLPYETVYSTLKRNIPEFESTEKYYRYYSDSFKSVV